MKHWIWIELIGFDNTLPDFGVAAYLSRCGFTPAGVSLLITWAQFPLSHQGMSREYPLHPNECSYGGHPYSPERKRQQWTNLQLAALIAEFHRHNIQVYLSYFNLCSYVNEKGDRVYGDFFKDRPFLMEERLSHRPTHTVHVLKRLEDGRYFEDLLQEKTVQVLQDYGFDGLQLADGISSGRLHLQEGDFSDDLLEQFAADIGQALPAENAPAYIWEHLRQEWIGFHRRRWLQFYRKFAARLKEAGKSAVFNSAWTRDPIEALCRYGIDYRAIDSLGLMGCMVEDVSAGLPLLSEEDNKYLMTDRQRRQVHYDFLATLMCNRAAMPNGTILTLTNIHDTQEQWGVLEHLPPAMTRVILANTNTLFQKEGHFRPITDGGWHCLGDSLTQENWSFIRKNWEAGALPPSAIPIGATWIWSDAGAEKEWVALATQQRPSGRMLLSRLLEAGAPLYSVARIEELPRLQGDLMVPNPDLLPPKERQLLAEYRNGTVWYLGPTCPHSAVLKEENTFGGLTLSRCGAEAPTQTISNPTPYTTDPRTFREPYEGVWTHPLTVPPYSDAFFSQAAALLTEETAAPQFLRHGASCQLIPLRLSPTRFRILLGNDEYYYVLPQVDLKRKIRSITCLTKYCGYQVPFEGSAFTCRVAGKGMEVLEIETE